MFELQFLNWDKPACELVAEKLLGMEEEGIPLYHCVVIVPTRESGRQLRQKMVSRCSRKAMLAPRVMTVDQFVRPPGEVNTMNMVEELSCWVDLLARQPLHQSFRFLFPEELRTDIPGALEIAGNLRSLRYELARHGLRVEEVYAAVTQEKERWHDLKKLNDGYERLMAERGVLDQAGALLAQYQSPVFDPIPVEGKLIVACVPELFRPVKRMLQEIRALGTEVSIWVHAPAAARDEFDQWGCPLPSLWNNRQIDIGHERIVSSSTPQALAEAACRIMGETSCGEEIPSISLGVCDPSFYPALKSSLALRGWGLYQPMKRPFAGTRICRVMYLLQQCIEEKGYSFPLEALMTSKLLTDSLGIGNQLECCRIIDGLRQKNLPEQEAFLLQLLGQCDGEVQESFKCLIEWRDGLTVPGQMGRELEKWCASLEQSGNRELNEEAALFREYAHALEEVQRNGEPMASPEHAIRLLVKALDSASLSYERQPEDVMDALGWLELQYSGERHLVVTGLHDGVVPEGGVEHQFLPESIRRMLGMDDFESKKARDSYLLTALVRSHSGDGRTVHFVVSRSNSNNDPLSPSPLLLRCADDELTDRINILFNEDVDPGEEGANYSRGEWHYLDFQADNDAEYITDLFPGYRNPWAGEDAKGFSPSTIRAYLSCPFRFWMEQVFFEGRAPDEYKDDKQAMNPAELGTLMHEILQNFVGRYPDRNSIVHLDFPSGELEREIGHMLENSFRRHFGPELPAYLYQQKQNLNERLKQFTSDHVDHLNGGWVNLKREWAIRGNWNGYPVNLKIDRVDVNHEQRKIRIVDYKTGKDAPEKKHLVAVDEEMPFLPFLQLKGLPWRKKFKRWIDLQLPFYLLVAQQELEEYRDYDLVVAYYNLPADIESVQWNLWEDLVLGSELMANAETWLKELMNAIREGRGLQSAEEMGFDPPSYSPFETLFAAGMENIKDLFGWKTKHPHVDRHE